MAVSSEPAPRRFPPARLALASALVALACAGALLSTSPGLPMVWDEGNAVRRSQAVRQWARLVLAPTRGDRGQEGGGPAGPWSRQGILTHWPYTTQIEGHPALYGIVIAAGRSISAGWLGPLDSWRFGPMMLFGLAAGAMFYRMAREFSIPAALGAVAAMMLLPRLFAHAHFASFDGPLVSCWILAWAAFASARQAWWGRCLFGIALGMTLSAKATGWIAPLPFVAWALLYRDRAAAKALAWGIPLALLTFFLLNPPLWHDPIRGWITFVRMNLNRGDFNVSTQFFGRMYDLDHPLPWYNTIVWTGITIPVGILWLTIVGVAVALGRWRSDRAGMLLVLQAAVLLAVRALPWAPPHDGVRLFLPAFPFLAALAGVGGAAAIAFASRLPRAGAKSRFLAMAGVLALYLGSATSLVWYRPQWLSYYNLLIGGLPGATALGMEPTYYWDGLDRSVLDWLHEHTAPGEKILFGPIPQEGVQAGPTENLQLMQRWGVFRREFDYAAAGRYHWYVLQRRPGALWPADRWLVENCRPAHRKTIGRAGWGPWRLDVPLVEVYCYEDYLRAYEASRRAGEQRGAGID